MVDFTSDSFRNRKHILYWYGLAFQAGAVNAGGFLSCHNFVSHVTGVGSQIGIQIGKGHLLSALELCSIPVFFLLGAILSALLVDRRKARGKAPNYVAVTGLIFFMLASVSLFGELGWFGTFGEPFELLEDVILVSALCMTCGLQNASVVSATDGLIRTTHLTGILTDFGIHLVRLREMKKLSQDRYRLLVINRVRFYTFLSFSVGSAISSIIFLKYNYWGFLVPTGTSLFFFWVSWVNAKNPAYLKRSA